MEEDNNFEREENGMKYSVTDLGSWVLVIKLSDLEQKLVGLAHRREKTLPRCLCATGVT